MASKKLEHFHAARPTSRRCLKERGRQKNRAMPIEQQWSECSYEAEAKFKQLKEASKRVKELSVQLEKVRTPKPARKNTKTLGSVRPRQAFCTG